MAGVSPGARALLYFHTIRHLKPMQIVWRVRRKLPALAAPGAGPAPSLRRAKQPLAAYPRKARSMVAADTFSFVNQTHRVAAAAGWNDPQRDALWLYNLHYFDDLCAQGAAERADWHQALIGRWIAENPLGEDCGWDPYPTSLRIVNWIKWALSGGELGNAARHSLAVQARSLARGIEWHLLGNHLLANAKGLVFAGCYFDGREAEGWLSEGLEILGAQLEEQVLPDGGHFERSPMYHAIALEDLLDLANVLAAYGVAGDVGARLRAVAPAMIAWLRAMTHPDGELAYFNDAAPGVAASAEALAQYASLLGIAPPATQTSVWLRDSGYLRLESGPFVALFDAAAVGPDYQPGHAHADTLSFELSYKGARVLCNSGVSTYEIGAQRAFERSTPAHNTVCVDGADSSEVWASFRVARRARPHGCEFEIAAGGLRASASHDGYARLRGSPRHHRELRVEQGQVRWIDTVDGDGEHEVCGYIPFYPGVRCELEGRKFVLRLPGDVSLAGEVSGDVALRLERGSIADGFNLRRERPVLVWSGRGALPIRVAVEMHEHAHPVSH